MKRAYGLEIPETLAETTTTEKCALVVYELNPLLGRHPVGKQGHHVQHD